MNRSIGRSGAAAALEAPARAEWKAPDIAVEGLGLRTRRGVVFENVELSLDQGSLGVLAGPSGAGKTALLLCLAGRMRFTEGSATVCGFDVRREAGRVRTVVGLGIIPGITDLDDTTTIDAQVRAELTLHRLPHDDRAVHRLLERFGLEAHPHAQIGSLGKGERLLLGVGLGLIHEPRVLMVDGVDGDLTASEQAVAWAALRRVADDGVTVVASCMDDPLDGFADLVVRLAAEGGR